MKIIIIIALFGVVLAYRQEQITKAQSVQRPSTNKILGWGGIDHHGILLKTSIGNTYLIHNMPGTGIVVTATPLSAKWVIIKELKVSGIKTIGGAMESVTGYTNIGIINYLSSGTCIGSKHSIKKYLER